MTRTFRYRFIKWSWGIAVDITADVITFYHSSDTAIEITEGIRLEIDGLNLSEEEIKYLIAGMRLVASSIRTKLSLNLPISVKLLKITYNPNDYQPEGLACAIIGWASQEFGFPAPDIPIHFDREQNRYIFYLPS